MKQVEVFINSKSSSLIFEGYIAEMKVLPSGALRVEYQVSVYSPTLYEFFAPGYWTRARTL